MFARIFLFPSNNNCKNIRAKGVREEKVIIIKYISDGLGTDEEMQVHKLAEQALYMHIAHGILSTKSNVTEYVVNRYKKEKSTALRNAKIRLSNIKLEEISQVLRGQSKWIKH